MSATGRGAVATGPGWELRHGAWEDVCGDVECDLLAPDPPYSARTHSKQRHGRRPEQHRGRHVSARGLSYEHWTPEDVAAFVDFWAPRTRGWIACLTDSELAPHFQAAYKRHGRTDFAPIPCVLKGMNVRLAGDGPSSWAVYLMVSRPKSLNRWGTLPGAYVGNPFDAGENTATAGRRSSVVGSKPLWLMREIVRDYSRPGDVVVDPCAGGGTTLRAAVLEGRTAIGAEAKREHFGVACNRLAHIPAVSEKQPTLPWAEGGDSAAE